MSASSSNQVVQNALKARSKKLKVAVLIGNGFDIGLGLQTSYKDFIAHYINRKISHDEIITKLIEHINRDANSWGDAEYAFGQLPFDKLYHDPEWAFRVCLKDFQVALEEYLSNESSRLVLPSGTEEKTRAFMLRSIVEAMAHGYPEIFADVDKVDIDILNFNYTDTVDRLLALETKKYPDVTANIGKKTVLIKVNRSCHVHGCLGDKILFGVDNPSQISNPVINLLSKSEGYLIKSSKAEIGKCLFYNQAQSILSECDAVFMFGLSYGKTDLIWWEKLLGPYYLGESSVGYRLPKIILCSYTTSPIEIYTPEDLAYIQRKERQRFLKEIKASKNFPNLREMQLKNILHIVDYGPFLDSLTNESYFCDPLHLHSIGQGYVKDYDRTPIRKAVYP